MQETYTIENLEQLRAISDPLRIRIFDLLRGQAMTVTQLGEVMKLAPAKVHYHVRELEKVGLLQLVETREKGGILEKYYQPVAYDFTVSSSLLRSAPRSEVISYIGGWFDKIKEGFMHAMRKDLDNQEEHFHAMFGSSQLFMTREELLNANQQVAEIFRPYEKRRNIANEQEMQAVFIAFPPLPLEDDGSKVPGETSNEELQYTPVRIRVVGIASYNKRELEEMVRDNKRLHLSVVGMCYIAKDVTPELADRAIEKLYLIGKLEASDAVKEVLTKKRV